MRVPQAPDRRSLLDLTAERAAPEFFGLGSLVMAVYLAVTLIWPATRSHEFAPLISLTLATALAVVGWKFKALHTRKYVAAYWLFLAACAFIGIFQTHASIDSMLTGSVVFCTVMAAQLMDARAAKACWLVTGGAMAGLFLAQQQGWTTVGSPPPVQGLVMAMTLLLQGLLQARFFNRASQAATEVLLQREEERRALAEEASLAKSHFLSVMSHEIRTPLNGIVGLVDLVQDERLDATSRQQYLHMLSQSSQALSSLVSGVLEFTKIEAGGVELVIERFSLVSWARDLESSFGASATVKGLFLQVELDRSAGDGAMGDAARLRQIAANYISNAIKFTKAGSIRVHISRPHGDSLLRLEVRDSGIGLTEAVQQRLFKPYSQGEAKTHLQYGGTGLGLSICDRLAGLMNGRVGVNSRPGVGSTFWAEVDLPMDESAPAADPAPPHANPPDSDGPSAPIHVDLDAARLLVVDDNAINRTVTRQMLRRMNAVVATAESGQEGLDAMRQAVKEGWPFDAVLMDVQMPGMSGLEAVRQIRADQALCITPVVALTAGVLNEDVSRAMEAGMDGFLAKPVGAEQLSRTVAHFVDMGRQRRSASDLVRF